MGYGLTQEKKMWDMADMSQRRKGKVGIWGGAFLWLRIGGGVKFFS